MKLDLLNNQWIEIVFEGRNKSYGAYDFRKSITKNSIKAFIIGTFFFGFAVSFQTILSFLPEKKENTVLNTKIVAVKLPPKREKPKENIPLPPPKPKVDQVKFVKPVVVKADEVVEEIVVIKEIKDKTIGKETIKGDPTADFTVEPVGKGVAAVVEDNAIYNSAGIEVSPEFPGGMGKFYAFIQSNFEAPEEASGKIWVSFVVEKDGSLTDIKIKDIGYGTGKETMRVLKKCPKWTPGEQNGKKVRCTYNLPISVLKAE